MITSESRTFRAPISDEVTLPCAPEHLGKFVLVWKHEDEVLTAGSMMVTPDSRFGLVGGYNLKIKNINLRNEGTYTCSISTFGDPVTVTHKLEILGKDMTKIKLCLILSLILQLLQQYWPNQVMVTML